MTSREEYRQKKQLDEARKAGTAPAEVDEDGKAINPHIPEYIAKQPWYIRGESAHPTLKHQRQEEKRPDLPPTRWYQRGKTAGDAPTKFRKGACQNCGSMNHIKRDCTERPRRIGAHLNQKNMKPDELIEDMDAEAGGQLSYDAKRDRWNGYDPSRHALVVGEYEKIEEERTRRRREELEKQLLAKQEEGEEEEEEVDQIADEDRVEGDATADFVLKPMAGKRQSNTNIRNLRIREDTAKYLRNLNPESAYYDPKTRSMRSDPNPNDEQAIFHGDNFVRYSGDTRDLSEAILFEMKAAERGEQVHLMAMPTQAEAMFHQHKVNKDDQSEITKEALLEAYGVAEEVDSMAPPKELLYAQTEDYVEYNRTGKIVRGQEKATAKSRFDEDVLVGNHSTVWGSWWEDGQWGYRCCHQCVKHSYCTGKAGIEAAAGAVVGIEAAPPPAKKAKTEDRQVRGERLRQEAKKLLAGVDEDEMEEWQRKQHRAGDPMAAYLD